MKDLMSFSEFRELFNFSQKTLIVEDDKNTSNTRHMGHKTHEETLLKELAVKKAIIYGLKDEEREKVKDAETFEKYFVKSVKGMCVIPSFHTRYHKKADDIIKIKRYCKYAVECSRIFNKNLASSEINLKNYKVVLQCEKQKRGEKKISIMHPIYKIARDLGGPAKNDNWNPADIWLIKKDFDFNVLKSGKSFCFPANSDNHYQGFNEVGSDKNEKFNTYNLTIRQLILNNILIPISLKLPNDSNLNNINFKLYFNDQHDNNTLPKPAVCKGIKIYSDENEIINGIKFELINGANNPANITIRLKSGNNGHTPVSYLVQDDDFDAAPESIAKDKLGEIINGLSDESSKAKEYANNRAAFKGLAEKLSKKINEFKSILPFTICNSIYRKSSSGDNIESVLIDQYDFPKTNIVDCRMKISRFAYVFLKTLEFLESNGLTKDNVDNIINTMYFIGLKLSKISTPHYKIYK